MTATTGASDVLARARQALVAGDLVTARALLASAVQGDCPAAARAMLGGLCYADDDFEQARLQWEMAFRQLRSAGEFRAAARVAAALADLQAGALGHAAVGRGWVERGNRMVRRAGRCVEEGYLAIAVLACEVPDMIAVERNAQLALDRAAEFEDADLEVRALAESGFALVAQGRPDIGFARLDEAMAAITGGDVTDLAVAGKSFCAMLSACDRSGDVRRAQEWTAVVAEYVDRYGGRPRILHTHCRAVYGAVLAELGEWGRAEQVMLEALSPSASRAHVHRVQTTAHLADLRIAQGRCEEAAELLGPVADCLAAAAPLARLHLARGEADLAAAAVERALHELVADRIREVPLLGLLVDAHLALDRVDDAAAVAARLAAVVNTSSSAPLRVTAALACARVCAARGEFGDAADLLACAVADIGGEQQPLLWATLALELAHVRAADGARAAALDGARAARATFDRIGAAALADRAAALLRNLGDRQRPRTAPGGATWGLLSARERQVLALIRGGLTNAEIGRRLFISPKTAEHHVGRVLAKLGARSRAEAAALAATLPATVPAAGVVEGPH